MEEIQETFSKDFRALWETGSDVDKHWSALEEMYAELKDIIMSQVQKLAQLRTLSDIERDRQIQ